MPEGQSFRQSSVLKHRSIHKHQWKQATDRRLTNVNQRWESMNSSWVRSCWSRPMRSSEVASQVPKGKFPKAHVQPQPQERISFQKPHLLSFPSSSWWPGYYLHSFTLTSWKDQGHNLSYPFIPPPCVASATQSAIKITSSAAQESPVIKPCLLFHPQRLSLSLVFALN